jgi:putative Mg2+ transporter-C (MgtC) family protein
MMQMPLIPTWLDISIRLLCAIAAGVAFGLNRSEHGRTAGLRTSILVCLAACVAMLQVNLLLTLAGRASDSFVMNDLMRLPLGILSGIGFIGAGAIVRRENFVAGVTTAATIWLLTVVGLCFGGGQVALGLAGSVIGVAVLGGLKRVEKRMKQDRQGKLRVVIEAGGPSEREIRAMLQNDGYRIASCGLCGSQTGEREMLCDLQWRARPDDTSNDAIQRLMVRTGVARIEWAPQVPTGF